MRATCLIIWTDGARNHFSFDYQEEETEHFQSWKEFFLFKCLSFFPKRSNKEIKWIIRE